MTNLVTRLMVSQVLLCGLLAACGFPLPPPDEIGFVGGRIVDSLEIAQLRGYHGSDGDILEVQVSTATDLVSYRGQYDTSVSAEAFFCDMPGKLEINMNPSVYWLGLGDVMAVSLYPEPDADYVRARDRIAGKGHFIFVVFINLSGSFRGYPYVEYNIRREPGDLCLRLNGGSIALGRAFESNLVHISREEIRKIVARRRLL